MPENNHFVITLMRDSNETPQEYVARCREIADFARTRSVDSTLDISPPKDEAGNPVDYQHTNPRDIHFKGSTKLLWHDIQTTMYRSVAAVEPLIAQRLYDFAGYVLDCTTEHELWAFKEGEEELENIVPDLTEWPKPD
jgi:hypothetical protein